MKRLLMAAALAACALVVPSAAPAANIAEVNWELVQNVLHDNYNITDIDYAGIKEIKRWEDGTVTVVYQVEQQKYSISYRSGATVDRDGNPCYAKFGGFHRPVGKVCVYDPDMYVSQVSERPRILVNASREDPTCEISTRTRTHTGKNPLKGYGIDDDFEVVPGSCNP